MKIETKYLPSSEAMQVTVNAYKSLISKYNLRTLQAERMTGLLMQEKISEELFIQQVVNRINEDQKAIGVERSTQYLGVLQATLISLTELQKTAQSPAKESLLEIVKALTITVNA